jgi:hypothetical protein
MGTTTEQPDLEAIEARLATVEMDLPELAARTLIEQDVPALIAEVRRLQKFGSFALGKEME